MDNDKGVVIYHAFVYWKQDVSKGIIAGIRQNAGRQLERRADGAQIRSYP